MKPKVLCTVLGLAATLFCSKAKEIVNNPGFEEIDVHGQCDSWDIPTEIWSISEETARSGRHSLLFDNSESDKYVFPTQELQLTPGKSYKFGCWIKMPPTIKAKPDICIMWYDENEKYLAGSYAFGSSLDRTQEWMPVQAVLRNLPTSAKIVKIACYVSHNAERGSRIWFDDLYVEEFIPTVLDGITTNKYRHVCDNGMVRVIVGADQSLAGIQKEHFTHLKLKILDARDRIVRTVKLADIATDALVFEFDSTTLLPGQYRLAVEWMNPVSKSIETVSLDFRKEEKLTARRVYIDDYKRMIVDGKPFFPLGLYFPTSTVDDKQLETYSNSPFNSMMPYAQFGTDYLDKLEKYNLKVFYNLKDYYKGFSGGGKKIQTVEEGVEKGLAKLKELKEHPAIVCWYINDELHHSRANEAIDYHKLIQEADPDRPTWSILNGTRNLRVFLPSFDIMGTDPYPIPNRPPRLALDWTRETSHAGFHTRMLLQVPQLFNWGRHWQRGGAPDHKVLQGRSPTFQEMKAMSWMCISAGANGLMYYSWMDLVAMDKLKDGILPREPFDERWNDVKKMAAEIKDLENVLLSIEEPIPVEVIANSAIGTRIYALDGMTWLLAVNADNKEANTVDIKTRNKISMPTVKLTETVPTLSDNTINITLDPLEVVFMAFQEQSAANKKGL